MSLANTIYSTIFKRNSVLCVLDQPSFDRTKYADTFNFTLLLSSFSSKIASEPSSSEHSHSVSIVRRFGWWLLAWSATLMKCRMINLQKIWNGSYSNLLMMNVVSKRGYFHLEKYITPSRNVLVIIRSLLSPVQKCKSIISHSQNCISSNMINWPLPPFFSSSTQSGMAYDTATTRAWNNHNKGKLWQDIRDKVSAEQND